jgi:hypothetical protein
MPIQLPHDPVTPPVAGSLADKVGATFAYVVQRGFSAIGDTFGSVIAGGLVAMLEYLEPGFLSTGHSMINDALASPSVPDSVKAYIREIEGAAHASSGITGWIYRLALTVIGFTGYQAPYGRLAQYQTEHQLHTARLGPTDLIIAMRRGQMSESQAIEQLTDQGFTSDFLSKFREMAFVLLGPQDLDTAVHRGLISEDDVHNRLVKLGYNDADATIMQEMFPQLPGPGDLMQMANRMAFDEGMMGRLQYDALVDPKVAETMAKQGYDPYWTNKFWRAHWQVPGLAESFDMLHRGIIDSNGLLDILRIQDYPPYWFDKLTALSYNPYTRVDVRRLYAAGVVTREECKQTYKQLGYDDEHAEKLTEWTAKEGRQAQKDLTKAEMLNGMIYGVISEDVVRAALLKMGYNAQDIDWEISIRQAQAAGYRRAPDRQVQKGDLTRAYIDELITRTELHDTYIAMGYSEAETNLLLLLADKTKDAPKRENQKSLVKTEVLAALRERLISREQAVTHLTEIGYDAEEVGFELTLVDYQISHDSQADQINTLHVLYTNGFKTEAQLVAELNAFNLPDTMVQNLIYKWGFEKDRARIHPTLAQLVQFNKAMIIRTDTLASELSDLGYSDKYVSWYLELIKRQTERAPTGGWQPIG